MPSYYDSKANKPGKAKRKYDDADIEEVIVSNPRIGMGKRKKSLTEGMTAKEVAAQRAKANRENRAVAKKRGVKKHSDFDYGPNWPGKRKAARERLAASYAGGGQVKYAAGGKVENGHDITYARGSGAARPQIFRKNG